MVYYMIPYYKNNLTTIYNGSHLEILKTYPNNYFDLLFTDPPYGIKASKGVGGFGSSPDKAKKYCDIGIKRLNNLQLKFDI